MNNVGIFILYYLKCYLYIVASPWSGVRTIIGNIDQPVSLSNNNTLHKVVVILGCKIDYGCNPGTSIPTKLASSDEQAGAYS